MSTRLVFSTHLKLWATPNVFDPAQQLAVAIIWVIVCVWRSAWIPIACIEIIYSCPIRRFSSRAALFWSAPLWLVHHPQSRILMICLRLYFLKGTFDIYDFIMWEYFYNTMILMLVFRWLQAPHISVLWRILKIFSFYFSILSLNSKLYNCYQCSLRFVETKCINSCGTHSAIWDKPNQN